MWYIAVIAAFNFFHWQYDIQTLFKDIAEIERMLKVLIKSLENKHLSPWPLESLDPLLQLNLEKNLIK